MLPATRDLDDADRGRPSRAAEQTIAADRFPMSPRVKRLRAILDKFDPAPPRPAPAPGEEEASAALAGVDGGRPHV